MKNAVYNKIILCCLNSPVVMKQLRHQKKIVQKEDVGSNKNCQSENTAKGFSEEYERFLDVDTIETNCPILRKGKIEQEKVEVYLLEHI